MDRHHRIEGFGIGRQPVRDGQEILELEIAAGMQTAGEDIDHRQRDGSLALSGQAPPQRDALRRCRRASHGARDSQDGIRPKIRFVGGAVECDQRRVHCSLVRRVHTVQRRSDPLLDVLHGRSHTFAGVAQLHRLVLSGGCSGRNLRLAPNGAFQLHLHRQRGIPARVQNL